MIRYFNYQCAQEEALELAKNSLLDLGYKFDLVAPEGYFILTKMQGVKKDIRQYDFRIAVLVEDRVEVIIVTNKAVIDNLRTFCDQFFFRHCGYL